MLNWNDPLVTVKPETENINSVQTAQTLKKSTGINTREQNLEVVTNKLDPVNPEDKRVINGQVDINQLAPFKYPWAWNYFLNANKNHWTPLEKFRERCSTSNNRHRGGQSEKCSPRAVRHWMSRTRVGHPSGDSSRRFGS